MNPFLTLGIFLMMIGVCRADLWEPWRKNANEDLNSASYIVTSAAPLVFKPWAVLARGSREGIVPHMSNDPEFPSAYATYSESNKAPKFSANLEAIPITKTEGCEVAFRFRIASVPSKMAASHALATFELVGPGRRDVFYLHVYHPPKATMKSGFILNELAKKGQWQRAAVTRGAVLPAQAVPLDRAWHTVRIAWRQGEIVVFFDNLLALRAFDSSISYNTFTVSAIRPGGDHLFVGLDLSALEARPVTFN